MYYILNKDKEPVEAEMLSWAEMFENSNERIVDHTELSDCKISTVFLGLNHGSYGKLELFETLVFGGVHDQSIERYSTWKEAQEGHRIMLLKCIEILEF